MLSLLCHTPGFLVDIYHNYEYLFFMCGSVILSGGLLSLLLNLCHFRALRKKEEGKTSKGVVPSQSDAEKQAQAEQIMETAAAAAEAAEEEEEAKEKKADVPKDA